MKTWKLYLSGEIHTDWREEIEAGCSRAGLPVAMSAPVTHHEASDDCGVAILGAEDSKFWHDHKGAQMNAIRTRTLIGELDLDVRVGGLGLGLTSGAVRTALAASLGAVADPLDAAVYSLLSALGLRIGEADIRVQGVRCGRAVLVQ